MRWKPWMIRCFALSRGAMILKRRLFWPHHQICT